MWTQRQARRLPLLSVLVAGAAVSLAAQGTIGAFAGAIRRNPSC
jgi:hypothetical protein